MARIAVVLLVDDRGWVLLQERDEFAPRALAQHLRELIEHGPPTSPVDVGR